ncbi:WhiB family transcriptional regulator [Streptomyces sp. NPDC090106]|uniref:WhiB family transcriptional regulator n=1 Tax=Streptomyces sp. NPDC090106 TaxID=3365946 RepID=UPI003803BE24
MKNESIVRASYAPSADLPVNTNWRDRAACKEEDPDLFFPIGNSGPALLQIQEAKAVCRRCPVLERCASWALESGEVHGVWGGMSENERRRTRRRAARERAKAA